MLSEYRKKWKILNCIGAFLLLFGVFGFTFYATYDTDEVDSVIDNIVYPFLLCSIFAGLIVLHRAGICMAKGKGYPGRLGIFGIMPVLFFRDRYATATIGQDEDLTDQACWFCHGENKIGRHPRYLYFTIHKFQTKYFSHIKVSKVIADSDAYTEWKEKIGGNLDFIFDKDVRIPICMKCKRLIKLIKLKLFLKIAVGVLIPLTFLLMPVILGMEFDSDGKLADGDKIKAVIMALSLPVGIILWIIIYKLINKKMVFKDRKNILQSASSHPLVAAELHKGWKSGRMGEITGACRDKLEKELVCPDCEHEIKNKPNQTSVQCPECGGIYWLTIRQSASNTF